MSPRHSHPLRHLAMNNTVASLAFDANVFYSVLFFFVYLLREFVNMLAMAFSEIDSKTKVWNIFETSMLFHIVSKLCTFALHKDERIILTFEFQEIILTRHIALCDSMCGGDNNGNQLTD